jgi:hypothetical protein
MELPVVADEFERFSEIASFVRDLTWIENSEKMCSECCAIASDHIYNWMMDNHSRRDLLMQLISLSVYCTTSNGVTGFLPWLSSSLKTLHLAFGPDITDMSVVSTLLRVRRLCTSLTSFTFILDSSNHTRPRFGVIDALRDAILAMPKLCTIELPSELITTPIIDALAQLSYLDTLACMPRTSPTVWDTTYTAPLLSDTAYATPATVTLSNMRMSARSWSEVATMVRSINPNLRRLVVSLPGPQSPHEMATAVEDIQTRCPGVQICVEDI